MNKKKSVSNIVFEGYGIELRPVTPRDLPSLRRWRNSPQVRWQMVNTSYITPRQQRLWYERIRSRVDQAHWVVWSKGVRTGYVNIKGEGPLELITGAARGWTLCGGFSGQTRLIGLCHTHDAVGYRF